MSDKERKFRQLLKEYGVTKCYVSEGFSFEDEEPCGKILVDVNDNDFFMSIYKLFTKDPDGFVGEDQVLWIAYNDFKTRKSNYNLED